MHRADRRRNVLTILGAVVLMAALVLVVLRESDLQALANLRDATVASNLPHGEVLYSHSDWSDWNGHDITVVETIEHCNASGCITRGPIFYGCVTRSATCMPWPSRLAILPAQLVVAPLGGYPLDMTGRVDQLLKEPSTECTAFIANVSDTFDNSWRTLCFDPITRTLFYRSVAI